MTITPRQIKLIQQSFSKVEPIAEQAAGIFYNKLFEYEPSVRPLFKKGMDAQGRMLMMTLKVAVKALNDLDALVPILQQLAKKHVSYGVRAEHYTPVGNALLFTLKTGLGPDWNPELRQAWVDVYRLMAQTMKAAAYR
jgi:hemoglobin-like flavoprotein